MLDDLLKEMKSIYPLFFLLATVALACRIDSPIEYLAQNSEIIIVGEIEKMDYDLPYETPYGEFHYSLAHVRIDETLKGNDELKKKQYFTFRVASKKDAGNTAIIYWDKGMKGTWFFTKTDEEGWRSETLKSIEASVVVKKELSYSPMRRFGKTFLIPQSKMGGAWPEKLGDEITLFQLVTYHNLYAEAGRSNYRLSLDEDLNPNIKIKKIDYDQTVIKVLRDIANQHEHLDFDFGDYQILFLDRKKVDSVVSRQ